jgi:uncharacterized protein YjaG (DUF416 family)
MLHDLDFSKQLVFAYLTCERLYPNYLHFSEDYTFGNPYALRKAIDYLFENLFETHIDATDISSLIQNIEKNTPDPALFDTVLASSALDACGVVFESLNFMLDRRPSRLADIATMATDTVDMYIQDIENLDFNSDKLFQHKIDTHPLMQKEKAIQSGILSFLSSRTTIDYENVRTLLRLQQSDESGNLRL